MTTTFDERCSACHGDLDRLQNLHSTWINLTHPGFSRLLNAPLAEAAGGLELCQPKEGREPVRFAGTDDATYQDLLGWITLGAEALRAQPRMDMPGAVAAAYEQDLGRLYRGGEK